jgi:hypothetical protein
MFPRLNSYNGIFSSISDACDRDDDRDTSISPEDLLKAMGKGQGGCGSHDSCGLPTEYSPKRRVNVPLRSGQIHHLDEELMQVVFQWRHVDGWVGMTSRGGVRRKLVPRRCFLRRSWYRSLETGALSR